MIQGNSMRIAPLKEGTRGLITIRGVEGDRVSLYARSLDSLDARATLVRPLPRPGVRPRCRRGEREGVNEGEGLLEPPFPRPFWRRVFRISDLST
jgi:hypothetical protein